MSNGDAGQTKLVLAQRIYNRCVLMATIEAAKSYEYMTIEEAPQGKWGFAGGPLPLFTNLFANLSRRSSRLRRKP